MEAETIRDIYSGCEAGTSGICVLAGKFELSMMTSSLNTSASNRTREGNITRQFACSHDNGSVLYIKLPVI